MQPPFYINLEEAREALAGIGNKPNAQANQACCRTRRARSPEASLLRQSYRQTPKN